MNNIKETIVERKISIPSSICEISNIQDVNGECIIEHTSKRRHHDHISLTLSGRIECFIEYITKGESKEIRYYEFDILWGDVINIYQKDIFNRKININSIIHNIKARKINNRCFDVIVLIYNMA